MMMKHLGTAGRCSRAFGAALVLLALGVQASAQEPKAKSDDQTKPKAKSKAARPQVPPTFPDVAYGDHPRQVLDFYKAESREPTPLVVYIHGGGWVNGDKRPINMIDVRRL